MPVDLNADLGEGFGAWTLTDDEGLLEIVTSANVACGFHAGDPVIMHRVCGHAARRGVAIGAQVSYRDLAGFGRRRMDVDPVTLWADVTYQLGALDAFARAHESRVSYVKPHGALYNTAADDPDQAFAIARAVKTYPGDLMLLGLPDSALSRAAEDEAIPFVAEGFADRAYTPEGRLVPRSEPDAVHTSVDVVVGQALSLVRAGTVRSLCLHGDSPGALEFARAVRAALTDAGIDLVPFA